MSRVALTRSVCGLGYRSERQARGKGWPGFLVRSLEIGGASEIDVPPKSWVPQSSPVLVSEFGVIPPGRKKKKHSTFETEWRSHVPDFSLKVERVSFRFVSDTIQWGLPELHFCLALAFALVWFVGGW